MFSEALGPPYINWNTCVSESKTCKMREVTISVHTTGSPSLTMERQT